MPKQNKPIARRTPLRKISAKRLAANGGKMPFRTCQACKGLRRVSKRRSAQLSAYAKARIDFLHDHPFCEVWLVRHGTNDKELVRKIDRGLTVIEIPVMCPGGDPPPYSTEIHHRLRRSGERLLDEKEWLAVSREGHRWIHQHPSEARKLGLLKK